MSSHQQLDVWYDGDCSVCRRSRLWCERHDDRGRLRFFDLRTTPEDAISVPRHELEASVWVQACDGTLFSGFEGWRQIVSSLPRWRWLARLTGLPPLCWLGPPAYRLVARLIARLSGPAEGRKWRPLRRGS